MRLYYFPANSAWCFVFGSNLSTAQPIALDGYPRFFRTRREAVLAAKSLDLLVHLNGAVTVRAPSFSFA